MVPTAYQQAIPPSGDSPTLQRSLDVFVRRSLDIIVALIVLALLSPILFVIYLRITCTSRGSAIFLQKRVGRDGRLFKIWKFRTMYVDADQRGPSVTSADDPRVTPFGRFLRSNKLDELPQFVNVLWGHMSLVGPRPQVPRFVEHFDESLRPLVLGVRPGITGPTTLHFRYEEIMLEDKPNREEYYIREILPTKLKMDAHYVQNRSLPDDLRVLWTTLWMFTSAVGRRLLRKINRSAKHDHDHDHDDVRSVCASSKSTVL
jgi:lipopolysaccharide/colanic/teichoic acid biosynthesis glycosyltransferase